MNRRQLIMVPFSLLVLVGCQSDTEQTITDNTEIAQSFELHADYQIPKDFEELEHISDLIIRGKAKEIVSIGKLSEDEVPAPESTNTDVEVLEVIKGDFEAEMIRVSEPYYLNEDALFESIENYIPMEMGKEYILFLRNNDATNIWGLTSLGFGKYAIDLKTGAKTISSFSTVGKLNEYTFISEDEEILNRYNIIFESVRENY